MSLLKYHKSKINSLLVVVCFFVFAQPLYSQSPSKIPKKDLESKKKRITEEINEINSLLNETKANKKSSIGALITINMKLEKRQDLINTINTEIQELNKEIKQSETINNQLTANLKQLKNQYAKMIVFAQRNQDAYSKLMFIFSASNFNQAYARLKYIQQYSEFRKKQANEIISTQTQLLANLNILKQLRHEKNVLLGNEVEEKQLLSSEKNEQEQVLTELQQKEKQLKRELTKKKEDAIQLQLAIKKLIADEMKRKAEEAEKAHQLAIATKKAKEEAKAKKEKKENKTTTTNKNDKTTTADVKENLKENLKENSTVPDLDEASEALSEDFANNRGKLPSPVLKGVICEGYGEHEHPAIKGFMMFNNGVEICAAKGTQVRAVFNGEVTGIATSPLGGKLVIIRHGEYSSVYCNLSDVQVKTGQKINVKQPIGTVLYNEDEGKNSMNLQIWKGQKTMDPSGWIMGVR